MLYVFLTLLLFDLQKIHLNMDVLKLLCRGLQRKKIFLNYELKASLINISILILRFVFQEII